VVIMLAEHDGRVLLGRQTGWPEGRYSALAGFVEPGESLEGCVHREVQEEVGLQIRNLRWFGSQSWAFPNSLMLAFHADYAGGELVLQPGEIEDARWFRKGEQPQEWPHPGSISYRLIRSALG
jgi:NAD+ diphosphatase